MPAIYIEFKWAGLSWFYCPKLELQVSLLFVRIHLTNARLIREVYEKAFEYFWNTEAPKKIVEKYRDAKENP